MLANGPSLRRLRSNCSHFYDLAVSHADADADAGIGPGAWPCVEPAFGSRMRHPARLVLEVGAATSPRAIVQQLSFVLAGDRVARRLVVSAGGRELRARLEVECTACVTQRFGCQHAKHRVYSVAAGEQGTGCLTFSAIVPTGACLRPS